MDILSLLLGFAVLVYSVILHEIAHGYVAERFGDPTARRAGRLTLNPLPHVDPMMTLALPAILYVATRVLGFGGLIFGSAKPVPVNPLYFSDPKKDTAIVAAAGALTNFLIAAVAALVYHLISSTGLGFLTQTLIYTVYINSLLGVFNLIPLPPLDGSKVLAAVLPSDFARTLLALEPYGFFLIFFLFLFTGLGSIIYRVVNLMMAIFGVPFI